MTTSANIEAALLGAEVQTEPMLFYFDVRNAEEERLHIKGYKGREKQLNQRTWRP